MLCEFFAQGTARPFATIGCAALTDGLQHDSSSSIRLHPSSLCYQLDSDWNPRTAFIVFLKRRELDVFVRVLDIKHTCMCWERESSITSCSHKES